MNSINTRHPFPDEPELNGEYATGEYHFSQLAEQQECNARHNIFRTAYLIRWFLAQCL